MNTLMQQEHEWLFDTLQTTHKQLQENYERHQGIDHAIGALQAMCISMSLNKALFSPEERAYLNDIDTLLGKIAL